MSDISQEFNASYHYFHFSLQDDFFASTTTTTSIYNPHSAEILLFLHFTHLPVFTATYLNKLLLDETQFERKPLATDKCGLVMLAC